MERINNMKCEACGKEHNGSYGSGRFCCQSCARSFSTKNNRKEINAKISKSAKIYDTGLFTCKYCQTFLTKNYTVCKIF